MYGPEEDSWTEIQTERADKVLHGLQLEWSIFLSCERAAHPKARGGLASICLFNVGFIFTETKGAFGK